MGRVPDVETHAFIVPEIGNKNWFQRNYNFVMGGIIIILLSCLGISAYNNNATTKFHLNQNHLKAHFLMNPAKGEQNLRKPSPSISGTTYKFTLEVNCACGGGEGNSPDLHFKIFTCADDGEYLWKSTKVQQNTYRASYLDAFQLRYDPGLAQRISLKLMDSDTFNDDTLMKTKCFDPFATSLPETEFEYSLKKCSETDTLGCENGFSLSVIKN